jgi:ribonuclease G
VSYEIIRAVRRDIAAEHSSCIKVTAHPEVVQMLLEEESDQLEEIQHRFNTTIQLHPDPNLYQEQYGIANC